MVLCRRPATEASIGRVLTGLVGEAAIPQELVRELLQDSTAPDQLHADLLLTGNCLCAATCGLHVLLFHPSGACGEQITLSALQQSGSDAAPWQVGSTKSQMSFCIPGLAALSD